MIRVFSLKFLTFMSHALDIDIAVINKDINKDFFTCLTFLNQVILFV